MITLIENILKKYMFFICILIISIFRLNSEPVYDPLFFGNTDYGIKQILEINAILSAYSERIESMEIEKDEVCFIINGKSIYYSDGKMLNKNNLSSADLYQSIFYTYTKGTLSVIPEYVKSITVRSSDFQDALYGEGEVEISKECRWIPFLNKSVFVNNICIDELTNINNFLKESAERSSAVNEFINGIIAVSSFVTKKVTGTGNTSFHSYGLAIDLIPISYEGKSVYWKWSAVFNDNWRTIPLKDRWSPPGEVIKIFEENGFIWGGKWHHFDTIHFEFRPEILVLSRD